MTTLCASLKSHFRVFDAAKWLFHVASMPNGEPKHRKMGKRSTRDKEKSQDEVENYENSRSSAQISIRMVIFTAFLQYGKLVFSFDDMESSFALSLSGRRLRSEKS
jgi:hypothetical protein